LLRGLTFVIKEENRMTFNEFKSMNYDAIVIGGGLGGLAFAASACGLMGKKVLVIEKNAAVGGRLYSFEREGFTLDVGAHVISRSEKGPLGTCKTGHSELRES
jgi:heterodisulfide reductase subunit A-like polyferredoxin